MVSCQSHRSGSGHCIGHLTLLPFVIIRQTKSAAVCFSLDCMRYHPPAHQLTWLQQIEKCIKLYRLITERCMKKSPVRSSHRQGKDHTVGQVKVAANRLRVQSFTPEG